MIRLRRCDEARNKNYDLSRAVPFRSISSMEAFLAEDDDRFRRVYALRGYLRPLVTNHREMAKFGVRILLHHSLLQSGVAWPTNEDQSTLDLPLIPWELVVLVMQLMQEIEGQQLPCVSFDSY